MKSPGERITSETFARGKSGYFSRSGLLQSTSECRPDGCPCGYKCLIEVVDY